MQLFGKESREKIENFLFLAKMYIVDSNIIIYSYQEELKYLRDIIANGNAFASEISRVEVLGYHRLSPEEDLYFKEMFELLPVILPGKRIFDRAIEIRKEYNLKLGDSIIAATALEYQLSIYTRNLSDFAKIVDLKCLNPII